MNGLPRDETADEQNTDGRGENRNTDTEPDLFMNTSGDDCADDQEGSNNPHILSESESEERDMDTIPAPNINPATNDTDGSVHGSGHGTEPEGGDQEMGESPAINVNNAATAANVTDTNSGANVAAAPAPAADPPATAVANVDVSTAATATDSGSAAGPSSSASRFGFGTGSGPSNPGTNPGGCGTSGNIDKNLANFSFCPTPENVKKIFSKKTNSS